MEKGEKSQVRIWREKTDRVGEEEIRLLQMYYYYLFWKLEKRKM